MSEDNQNKLPWWTEMFNQEKLKQFQQNIDTLRAFEILKAYCKTKNVIKIVYSIEKFISAITKIYFVHYVKL